VPDIVVASTGRRHGGRVRVIDGRTGQQLAGPLGAFTAFSGGQGVTLSLADASGDGVPDLVVGARVAGRTLQKVYSIQTGTLLAVLGGPSRRRHRRLR